MDVGVVLRIVVTGVIQHGAQPVNMVDHKKYKINSSNKKYKIKIYHGKNP